MAEMPAVTKIAQKGVNKTFGASFEKFGSVKAGGVLSLPECVIGGTHGVVIGVAEINAAEFQDDGDGDPIPIGKGVIARWDMEDAIPGTYRLEWTTTVTVAGVPNKEKVSGKLIITDPP
jgi:hypothetical protein